MSPVNEKDLTYEGCYGSKLGYDALDDFLDECFQANIDAEKAGSDDRFSTCVWGHSGIGKTAKIKQRAKYPVTWAPNGDEPKEYPGQKVYNVPIAQMEEMGDLHGMPDKHVEMAKGEKRQWVPTDVVEGWQKESWDVMASSGVRTMYAPPDWVPREPGPSILLLDDWNRASGRIIKGIMQLLQNYAMVSWSLPPGCNIVLTGNPDEQDYLVTSIDSAILTRIRSATLVHEAKEWAVWAQGAGIDSRLISFALSYPEMMVGPERTNPRTLAEFGRNLKRVPDVKSKENQKKFMMMGNSLLDEDTVRTSMVFFERDVEMVIEPEQILAGEEWIEKKVSKLMKADARGEKRVDVIGVICDRLFAYVVQPDVDPKKNEIENFQKFVTTGSLPEDLRHNLCLRIARVRDNGRMQKWIMHNKLLTKMIMDVV